MMKFISLAVLLGVAYAAEILRNPLCKEKNLYLPIEGQCDSYIECRNYAANEMLCPDGLHYNPLIRWPAYPCGYPTDVSCQGRGVPQPAKPTAECPHQYGFFPALDSDPANCAFYRMCIDGQAIEMQCPPGLAFNAETARCDWPDLVRSCNAEQYLGFQCPPAPLGEDGEPLESVNYAIEGNCHSFFSCEHGRPRLLSCDEGYAFDAAKGHCVDADEVRCASLL